MSSHENDAWFSRQIETLGPTLFRVAFAILRNRTDCEDAAQNAVLKAYRNLAREVTKVPFSEAGITELSLVMLTLGVSSCSLHDFSG